MNLQKRVERKEIILGIRSQLRQNNSLRESVVNSICDTLNIHTVEERTSLQRHLTIALDDELNDNKAHVIV